jgi:hypothetical protein
MRLQTNALFSEHFPYFPGLTNNHFRFNNSFCVLFKRAP